MVDQSDEYIARPIPNWEATLGNWNKFITAPLRWGLFAVFTLPIERSLYHNGFFNVCYREALQRFTSQELIGFKNLLHRMIYHRHYWGLTTLTEHEAELLSAAIERFGQLHVGLLRTSWPLESFSPTKRPHK